ncbi:MAG TPA: hypothetical protein VGR25_13200 [bacterium]|nr:hypothetical protein [bacterium]
MATDPLLLGLTLSPAQEALLRAVYGLPPASAEHVEIFRQCTGRAAWPCEPFGEITLIAGARAGKDSRVAAPIAVYEALFGGHETHLHKGERAVIPLVAQDQRATRIAFGYLRDYCTGSALLAGEVAETLANEVRFQNGLAVYCFPCTQRSLRGWSIPAAVMDELAFFRLEGATDSDAEIQASLRRGMLGFPAPKLVKISTPYMKSGVVFDDFGRFGEDDPDRLVWRAPTALMNPAITAERLERERRLDPLRFAREFEAEFAEDVDSFLPEEWIARAVVPARGELPPQEDVRYIAAVDPSGGGADAFTLAIVHRERAGGDEAVVVDACKGWHKVGDALGGVVAAIAETVRSYRCGEVVGDRYAAGWVRERFAEAGLYYREAEGDKSAAYAELEPLFAQGRIALPDLPPLVRELRRLERRPQPGGRIRVDHPRGAHDDYATALAHAVAAGARRLVAGVHYGVM